MQDTENLVIRVRIYGHVQGVWYRGWVEKEANSLNLEYRVTVFNWV